ncbi:MAG: tetratricopeptide repeat protein [Acidobacteriota bacterium]
MSGLHLIMAGLLLGGGVQVQPRADVERQLTRAIRLEEGKDFAAAEGVYREVLKTLGEDPEVLRRLGLVCQQQGKFDESIQVFQRILKRAPVYPGVNTLVAISQYALNRFDKAIEAAQKELVGNPTDKQAKYYLSLAFSASGRLLEAIQQLEQLRVEDPQNAAVLYQLAVDYKAAAQQAGQRLTRTYPDSAFARAIQAEVLADTERFDEAIAAFKDVQRKDPKFPGIHLALGQVHWRRKDLDKARVELELALVEEPNQALAQYYLGDIFVSEQEFERAIPHLERAISVYPELTRAYWLLGKSYSGSGEPQRAVGAFKKALEQDPNYKEVHFQLHEVYARLGMKRESQQHLEIFQRLTQEAQKRDRRVLEEAVGSPGESGSHP